MTPGIRGGIGTVTLAAASSVGCGSPEATPPVASESASPARAESHLVRNLTIRTTDGRTLSVPEPQRPTVVYFMAAWCVSCIQGARQMAELQREYEVRSLRVVAIDADQAETAEDLARFRGLAGDPQYDWALDSDGRITQALAIRSLDATLLVSPKGEVLFRSESLPNPNTLRRAVQLALGL